MTLHVLVEGPSERAFFERWGPRLLPAHNVRVHPHQGKGTLPRMVNAPPDSRARGLLDQLPAKLRGFAAALDAKADGVLVLVDADDQDVEWLMAQIRSVADQCAPQIRVGISVAVEEMEAFYLGDLRALQIAFPEADMHSAREYVPDSICGTWELFGRIVGDDGGNKVSWGLRMGAHVTTQPAQSRSPSFKSMIKELLLLAQAPHSTPKRRRYLHRAKARK